MTNVHIDAIVIYGGYETGKTLNTKAFSKFYRKSLIVDEWKGRKPLEPNSLALVNMGDLDLEKAMASTDYLFISIESAKDTLRANGVFVIDPLREPRERTMNEVSQQIKAANQLFQALTAEWAAPGNPQRTAKLIKAYDNYEKYAMKDIGTDLSGLS
jgi:hypothetical protein